MRIYWAVLVHLSPQSQETESMKLSINEIFPPITAEDVGERITKIRNKSATGPDGLQKEYLLVPGLPEILAKYLISCAIAPVFRSFGRKTGQL